MRNLNRFAVLVLLWLIPVILADALKVQSYSERDALDIYAIVLPSAGKNSPLVVTTTLNPTACVPRDQDMPDDEFRAALAHFRDVNQQTWDISLLLRSETAISKSEIDSVFERGILEGWKQFRRKHPRNPSYVAVSAIGFSAHHTAAIVYSHVVCGPKCGTGRFRYFRRMHDRWIEVTGRMPKCTWIS